MLWIKKATAASIALFAMFALGVGVGVSTFQVAPAADVQENAANTKAGISTEPTQSLNVGAEEPDIDKIINDLENELKTTWALCRDAMEAVNLAEKKVAMGKSVAMDGRLEYHQEDLDSDMETLVRFQKEVDAAKKKMEVLKKTILTLREYKDQLEKAGVLKTKQKQTAPPEKNIPAVGQSNALPAALDDLDKKIAELQQQRVVLQIKLKTELLNSRLSESALRTELKEIDDKIDTLVKQKGLNQINPTAANRRSGYFQLSVETKDAAWPFVIREYGPDGKLIGKTAFDNSAVLGRFLARAMKDSTAPKEVRISAQDNTPIEMLSSAIEVCKTAGFAQNYFDYVNPKKRLAEWLNSPEKPKNTADKEKTYPNVINDLYSKYAETQKRLQLEETEKNNRDAARKAIEWFQKRMANEPPNPPRP